MARVQKNDEGHCGDPSGPSDAENGSLPPKENGKNLDFAEPYEYKNPDREEWSNKIDFILSCVGFAVGLGNVWRFPYLCYKNGGGAFLVPYFLCLVCGGVPVFFLEVALGQFMSQGGLGVWKICPLFKGIGVATTVIVFLLNIYYIVILAWDVNYLGMAFTSVLPWAHCNNSWNTWRCSTSFGPKANNTLSLSIADNETRAFANSALGASATNFTPVDPVVEFWEYRILRISNGVDQPGEIVWQLALSLFIVWVLCYFCIWKGVKWTGKVVYFTATFPYVVLTVLLVRGVTLPGSVDGLLFYLRPDFTRLADAQVWIDAGTQIFFSYAIALGAMTALGSYNKFKNDCYRDCVVIAGVNSFTSIYAGFVIFSVLGFMAHEQGVSVDQVAESGPGLAFIAYPKAVTQMPCAPLWAILFFVMILMLGLDSQFVGMEAFITVVCDLFPILRKKWYKEVFVAGYSIISFLLGLTMVTNGGMYVFQLFDYYSASGMALLWVCFFECVVIGWLYGGRRFYDNLEQMIGYRINPWLRICWTYITPLITLGIMIFMWIQFKPLTYNRDYRYPVWAQGIGMCMAFSSMICIPGYAAIQMIITPGSIKERLRKLTTPMLKPHQIPNHWDDGLKLAAQQHYSALDRQEGNPFITSSVGDAKIVYKVAPPPPPSYQQSDNDMYKVLSETKIPLVDKDIKFIG